MQWCRPHQTILHESDPNPDQSDPPYPRNATMGAEGCPIGVQVVGRHYQEELVIHAMAEVERLVRDQENML